MTSPRTLKGPTPEIHFVAFVLHLGEAFDDFALPQAITDTHRQDHLMVLVAIADTVNTGNRRDDDAIAAFKQAFGRRKAHLLDMLVDRRVFLDKQITCGNVGFWLIVVVVGDEVLDGILGEELPEFGVQLRGQCLVRRQNQRRTPHAGDHIGHGVGFSRTCDAEQCLKRQSVFEAFDQPSKLLPADLLPAGTADGDGTDYLQRCLRGLLVYSSC
jgi:hypothetical protein